MESWQDGDKKKVPECVWDVYKSKCDIDVKRVSVRVCVCDGQFEHQPNDII